MRISLDGRDWLLKDFVGEDWRWRNAHTADARDTRNWRAATVPGSVLHDLWQLGEVSDPHFERNSLLAEWVPQRTWLYRRSFHAGEELRGRRIALHFEGVDYDAEFFLNGESLGRHRSMYTPAVFEIGERLRYGQDNLIVVAIEAVPIEQPQVGRTSAVRSHKARMNYWWDFCPRLLNQGLWDRVWLAVTGPARIRDVYVRPQLAPDLGLAQIGVTTTTTSTQAPDLTVRTVLRAGSSLVAERTSAVSLRVGQTETAETFELANPALWWPNGYGEQALYTAEVSLELGDGSLSDERKVTFGIRRIEMAQNDTPDRSARPYTFVVNGRRIYAKGWNWVPMDAMYGVERPAVRERLIELARRANVNLLRIWGGGLIEKGAFYDLCDRAGIMVWQEFIQSSSGVDNLPPEDPQQVALMVSEAEKIIPRRRNHPSLALWCGGNELMFGSEKPCDEGSPMLAALYATVRRLDPDRCWLPTSSSGRSFSYSLENVARDPLGQHDVHGPWKHLGLTEQYTLYNQGTSLFHSEFGAEGITNLKTLAAHISRENRWPFDRDNAVLMHSASWWIMPETLEAAFGPLADLESLQRASQFMQAEGLRYAVEADRRRKWQNSGTLPWQFNEPFPNVACTSAVDYHAQPKPVYHAVARAYGPLSVTARFATQAWGGRPDFAATIWANNSGTELVEAELTVRLVGAGGQEYGRETRQVTVPAAAAHSLLDYRSALYSVEDDVFFLDLALHAAGRSLCAGRYLFSRGADLRPMLDLPNTELQVSHEDEADTWRVNIANTGQTVALPLWLEDERPVDTSGGQGGPGYAYFDDNYFILLPGESRTVSVTWDGVPAEQRSLRLSGWNVSAQRIA